MQTMFIQLRHMANRINHFLENHAMLVRQTKPKILTLSLAHFHLSHYLISLPFLPHQSSDLDFARIVMVSQGGVW